MNLIYYGGISRDLRVLYTHGAFIATRRRYRFHGNSRVNTIFTERELT